MRRGVGVSSVQKHKKTSEAFANVGKALEETKMAHIHTTLEAFKTTLSEFAVKYRSRINEDPEFRLQFCRMCDSIGVDPLTSSKGFWTDMFDLGDFYFELGVVIIRICVQTRAINGGVMSLEELAQRVRTSGVRSRTQVSTDDIRRAVRKIAVLGGGFQIVDVDGGATYVKSVPTELSRDHIEMIDVCNTHGYVSASLLESMKGWSNERFVHVVEFLIQEEMLWVDENNGLDPMYMMPTFAS